MQGDIVPKSNLPSVTPLPTDSQESDDEITLEDTRTRPTSPPTKRSRFSKLKHHWLTIAFILGFVIDNLTLNRVDQVFDNLVLASYVLIAMISMLFLYAGSADKLPEAANAPARRFAPLLMQYAFGGLLSGMLIFYGRAGAFVTSWPYLAIIALAIYGNETIRDRVTRLRYNVAILFIGLFSYVVLVVPVLTGLMGPWIFVGSGLIALVMMFFYLRLLGLVIPHFMSLQRRAVVFILGVVFCGFNFFYFTNIIPPIPLSLKDAGIFHSVVRFGDGSYQVKFEQGPWWQFWKDSDTTIHPTPGESIFCYAQVFAPTKLQTNIIHVWEYHDTTAGRWQEHARLSYAVTGGRDAGFRGYTLVTAYRDGKWRCSVETARGQLLGRETFTVDTTQTSPSLVTEMR